MSQRHLLHKEVHVLEDKIIRLMGDLTRLNKQKQKLVEKIAELNMKEASNKVERDDLLEAEDEIEEARRLV